MWVIVVMASIPLSIGNLDSDLLPNSALERIFLS